MTKEKLRSLKRGDLVAHVTSGNSYVIERELSYAFNHPVFIAVETILITNPDEWVFVPREKKRRRLGRKKG